MGLFSRIFGKDKMVIKMKKHKKTIVICSVMLAIVILAIVLIKLGNNADFNDNQEVSQKPFNDLSAEDILSITVFAIPPNETVLVDDMVEIEIIVEILRTVIIYQKSDEWKNTGGQGVTFTISKTTDEVVEVRPYGSYLIIDGQGYRTEYQPSENLNRIANTILDTPFGGQPIE